MYIHLGGEIAVRTQDVIAILDYGKLEKDKALLSLIQASKQRHSMIWISDSDEWTKSIVITDDRVYGSPISPQTLLRRA